MGTPITRKTNNNNLRGRFSVPQNFVDFVIPILHIFLWISDQQSYSWLCFALSFQDQGFLGNFTSVWVPFDWKKNLGDLVLDFEIEAI